MAYNGELVVDFDNFSTTIPFKYEKFTSKEITDQIKIVSKADDGETVLSKFRYVDINNPLDDKTSEIEQLVQRKKVLIGETNGQIYTSDEVNDFQIRVDEQDNVQEIPVESPDETTKKFEVSDTRTMDSWDSYLTEGDYEVYVEREEIGKMKKLADYLVANDIILMTPFQRVNVYGSKVCLFKPIIQGDKFVMMMRMTMTKYQYNHLLDVSDAIKERKTNQVEVKLAV